MYSKFIPETQELASFSPILALLLMEWRYREDVQEFGLPFGRGMALLHQCPGDAYVLPF